MTQKTVFIMTKQYFKRLLFSNRCKPKLEASQADNDDDYTVAAFTVSVPCTLFRN